MILINVSFAPTNKEGIVETAIAIVGGLSIGAFIFDGLTPGKKGKIAGFIGFFILIALYILALLK